MHNNMHNYAKVPLCSKHTIMHHIVHLFLPIIRPRICCVYLLVQGFRAEQHQRDSDLLPPEGAFGGSCGPSQMPLFCQAVEGWAQKVASPQEEVGQWRFHP